MQTVEYREFAAQFPARLRRFVVTWRWPLLFSLLLHGIAFWPASQTITPTAFASRPLLNGRLQVATSPDLPELPASGATVAGHRTVTKSSAANRPSMPVKSNRDEAFGTSAATMQISNVAVDAGGLRSYRVGLARALSGGAWRSGLNPQLHGVLEVGVAVDAAGRVQEVGLVRSSGVGELDRRLLEAVRAAVWEVAVPPVLQSQSFFVVLPIEIGEPISAAGR